MKNHLETAIEKFDNGFNCSQSVLFSFCEELKIEKDIALKLACGFGGGMGRKGEVCGTVTGGIMAIGLKYGNDSNGGIEKIELTRLKTRELMDNFTKIHGTYLCRKLLDDNDLNTEVGKNKFKELDLKNKVCKQCMSTVINYLEQII